MKSIGFSEYTNRKKIKNLIQDVVLSADRREYTLNEDGVMLGEFCKDFTETLGVAVCGEFDEDDKKILNTLPYFKEFVSLLPLIPDECLNDFYICREINGNMSPLIPKRSLRNYFLGKLQEGDAIYMSLHQRFEKECRVYDVNVTIVQQEFTNLDILLKVGSLLKSKVISIRYTNKIDEKWLKAEKEN